MIYNVTGECTFSCWATVREFCSRVVLTWTVSFANVAATLVMDGSKWESGGVFGVHESTSQLTNYFFLTLAFGSQYIGSAGNQFFPGTTAGLARLHF